MPKMVAPDKHVKQTEVGGYRYTANRQGLYKVESPSHVAAMKSEGFIEASMMGATTDQSLGYNCSKCGFGSWFKKCSRCGSENE
jgi:hypothetical protein